VRQHPGQHGSNHVEDITKAHPTESDNSDETGLLFSGRCWTRTCDPLLVRLHSNGPDFTDLAKIWEKVRRFDGGCGQKFAGLAKLNMERSHMAEGPDRAATSLPARLRQPSPELHPEVGDDSDPQTLLT
jgi:hypothetical protein